MAVFSIKWFYLKGIHLLGYRNTFAGKCPAFKSGPVTGTSRLVPRPFFLPPRCLAPSPITRLLEGRGGSATPASTAVALLLCQPQNAALSLFINYS